jgi:RHS repeat-associated protein
MRPHLSLATPSFPPGREYNSQFGFYEYRARAYHPGLGRFMSEDPKGFGAGDYNFYRYCGNDPWDETDPMGLSPGTATWAGQSSGGALEGERAVPQPTPAPRTPLSVIGFSPREGDVSRANNYFADQRATVVNGFADRKVSYTDKQITETNKDGNLFPVQSKTWATLDYPQAQRDPEGVMQVSQRLGLYVTLPTNASKELVAKEAERSGPFYTWLRVVYPNLVLKGQFTRFNTTSEAARAVNNAVRPSFNELLARQIINFDFR